MSPVFHLYDYAARQRWKFLSLNNSTSVTVDMIKMNLQISLYSYGLQCCNGYSPIVIRDGKPCGLNIISGIRPVSVNGKFSSGQR